MSAQNSRLLWFLFVMLLFTHASKLADGMPHGGVVQIDPEDSTPVTFGQGLSQFVVRANEVQPLWSYTGQGVIQFMWVGGVSNCDLQFQVTYDGSPVPQLVFSMNEAIGVGFSDETGPWGNSITGKGATWGCGGYVHIRIPFTSSIRYDVKGGPGPTTLWWQIRGTPGLPIVMGNFLLPLTAKLFLYRNDQVKLEPLQFITLANTTNAGVVFMHSFQAQSSNLNYLEGCYRTLTPGDDGKGKTTLISTGTEDYFQSSYYFNAGLYHFPGAGFTHSNPDGTLSAYKIHQYDPLFFGKGGFAFVWRNGDTNDPTTGLKCVNDNGDKSGDPQPTVLTTLTWVYEW